MALIKDFNYSSMRFLGTLQVSVVVNDAAGGQTNTWSDVLTTRVSLDQRSGRLNNGQGKMEYYKNYILNCRFQNAIQIDPDSRWLINGEYYKIEDWGQVDMEPFRYEFIVTKNQSGSGGI